MKELKEYRDEIFRRSDEKKRRLKERRRIALGAGISICLCCVLMATFRPGQSKDAAVENLASNKNAVCDSVVSQEMESVAEIFQFTARVVECGESWVLVEPLESEAERNSSDRISFSTQNLQKLDIQVGAVVVITYNGEIMESYPAQITPTDWKLK